LRPAAPDLGRRRRGRLGTRSDRARPNGWRRLRAWRHAERFEETTHPLLLGQRRRALHRFVRRRRSRRLFRIARALSGKPFEDEREPGEDEKDDRVVHLSKAMSSRGGAARRGTSPKVPTLPSHDSRANRAHVRSLAVCAARDDKAACAIHHSSFRHSTIVRAFPSKASPLCQWLRAWSCRPARFSSARNP